MLAAISSLKFMKNIADKRQERVKNTMMVTEEDMYERLSQ